MDETQHRLLAWTYGQHSERLAAQVLADQGFQDIDPSHPYGGPDGGRDIKCTKNGRPWIGAVYFPRGQQTLATIKTKLTEDLASARTHSPQGVAFVTNQELTLSVRGQLEKLGGDIEVEIFHMERIAIILDRPQMHSLRKQFLDIDSDPAALDISLDISGAAHYFVDGATVRDHLIDSEEQNLRERHEHVRELSPQQLRQQNVLLAAFNQQTPDDVPTEEETEAAVAALHSRMKRSWPRSEQWLGIRGWDGLTFTVNNQAESFLTNVELAITFHGVHGIEKEIDTQNFMEYLVDPDYTPSWQESAAALFTARLANREVQWDNVGTDLKVTITLDQLRPQPSSWTSLPDEVIVIVPPDADPIKVTWFATAAQSATSFHGAPIELPVHAEEFRDALQRVKDADDAARS